MSGSLSLASDYRLRGHSFSDRRPVATLAVNWDAPNGFYVGLAALGVLAKDSGPEFLGAQESLGFAHRLSPGMTLDIGVLNTNYSEYWNGVDNAGYTEAYVGLIGRGVSTHVYVSPNYLHHGVTSVYGEVDVAVRPAPLWRLSGHGGLQSLSNGPHTHYSEELQYDWRLGVARQLGAFDLELALSGGGPGKDPYSRNRYGRTAVVLSGSWSF